MDEISTAAVDECGCPPVPGARASRRGLLRGAALVGATTVFGSTVVTTGTSLAAAATPRAASVVVVLSLRGAADGLSLVVPHGDPAYYAGRPTTAIPADSLLAKDAFFGLHPAMAPLLPMWSAGKLAAVHATGLPVPNRSHFSAMEEIEDADPGSVKRVGWLNRLVGEDSVSSSVQALAVGSSIPASLQGPQAVMGFRSLEGAVLSGGDAKNDPNQTRMRALVAQWSGARTEMAEGFRSAMSAVVDLGPAKAQVDRTATYPQTDLGKAMSSIARTLRGDVGVTTVTVDSGNWDMHVAMGSVGSGWMTNNAKELSTCIATFFSDLGPVADKVTVVTISEFGRRVQENGTKGLDHGWGNVMLVAGAGVKGGQYYGRWTPLQNTVDGDLAVTTDYRSVLSEVVAARTTASTAKVFPGFQRERVGVMTGQ